MKLTISILLLLVGIASGHWLESPILLPDTFGSLVGPMHLAWDDGPDHPRLYFGGEGGDGGVIVVDARSYKKLARISTGPVSGMCFSPVQRKLYVSTAPWDAVSVVDAATNQVTKCIPVRYQPTTLLYNRRNDRVYCAAETLTAIDCASDTVVSRIPVRAEPPVFTLDSGYNRLYVSTLDGLTVIDCDRDSVVTCLSRIPAATALCYNATAKKVYAVARDTLFGVDCQADTVVAALHMSGLQGHLACDPTRGRVFVADQASLSALDCTADTVVTLREWQTSATGMVCDPSRNRLYFSNLGERAVRVLDGTTGNTDTLIQVSGRRNALYMVSGLDAVITVNDSGLSSVISCSRDSVEGVVPNAVFVQGMCVDSTDGKLYFVVPGGCGCIGVVDCSSGTVESYILGRDIRSMYGDALCWNPNCNRLYVGNHGNFVSEYDCSSDSLLRHIRVSGRVSAFQMHPGLNKLYALAHNYRPDAESLNVIDCRTDSVVECLAVLGSSRLLCLVPERNTLWWLCVSRLTVMDCVRDSVVVDTAVDFGDLYDACYSLEDRKVFAASRTKLTVMDMDNYTHLESLPRPSASEMTYIHVVYVPGVRKVYWSASQTLGGSDGIYVIDSRTNVVVSRLDLGFGVSEMQLDRTGSYIYCSGLWPNDALMAVVDASGDSVISVTRIPQWAPRMALNERRGRLYLGVDYFTEVLPVIRDSVAGVGVADARAGRVRGVDPTVVRRGSLLRSAVFGVLADISGRKVAELHPGANDVRHLSPGVYFIREGRGAGDAGQGQVRKVVITR